MRYPNLADRCVINSQGSNSVKTLLRSFDRLNRQVDARKSEFAAMLPVKARRA